MVEHLRRLCGYRSLTISPVFRSGSFALPRRCPAASPSTLQIKGQPAPNGITWDSTASRFVIVPNGDTTIVSWAPGDSAPQPLATAPTMMDGVEALGGGRYLVTSWADSSLHLVADGKVTRIASGIAAPADIGRIDAGCLQPHPHLAGAGHRRRHLAMDQHLLCRSRPLVPDRFHFSAP